ncbi:MAG TPA: VCBS repeat-containing protein [Candidatus Polarisedimenticolia bacterium]|jgi:hypothetical protein|nr:VCBS repeat-containing protein [Candidatus Polarisedimenticolia bacterium]
MTSISLNGNVGRPSPLVHADFDSDGHEDLALGGDSTRAVWVLLGNGDGTFQDLVGYGSASTFGSPVNLATGDFNHDGHIDIAAPEYFSDIVDVFLGVGNGTFAPALPQSLPSLSNSEGIAVAD